MCVWQTRSLLGEELYSDLTASCVLTSDYKQTCTWLLRGAGASFSVMKKNLWHLMEKLE
jgi:hypothetical protein